MQDSLIFCYLAIHSREMRVSRLKNTKTFRFGNFAISFLATPLFSADQPRQSSAYSDCRGAMSYLIETSLEVPDLCNIKQTVN